MNEPMTVFSIFHLSNNHHICLHSTYADASMSLWTPLPSLLFHPVTSSTDVQNTRNISGVAVLLESILCTWGSMFFPINPSNLVSVPHSAEIVPSSQCELTDWKAQLPFLRLYSSWHPCNTRLSGHIWSLEVSSLCCLTVPHLTSLLTSFPSTILPHLWTKFSFSPHLVFFGFYLFSLSDTCALPALRTSIWIIFPHRCYFPGAPTCCSVLQGGHSIFLVLGIHLYP